LLWETSSLPMAIPSLFEIAETLNWRAAVKTEGSDLP
jgi:hypothetical protein